MKERSLAMEQAHKSPIRKLLNFFETSRDKWKEKHHDVKAKLKKEQNQVRAVENSRERWRKQAEELGKRVRELEAELAEIKGTIRPNAAAGRGVDRGL